MRRRNQPCSEIKIFADLLEHKAYAHRARRRGAARPVGPPRGDRHRQRLPAAITGSLIS
jgi:hypothetical protein